MQSVAYHPKETTHTIFSVFTLTSFLTSKVLVSVFLVLRNWTLPSNKSCQSM